MIKFLVLLLFVGAPVSCRPNENVEPLLVRGSAAKEGVFPFVVSIRKKPDIMRCGGTIISKHHILTAAHCVKPSGDMGHPSSILVGIGSVVLKNQKLIEVAEIILNPDYQTGVGFNDIAILKLKEPLTFSETVQPIKFDYKDDLTDKNVVAMGWGKTEENGNISPVLLFINSFALSQDECKKRFNPRPQVVGGGDICFDNFFGQGMCTGDGGTPMLYTENGVNYVVGVLSRSVICARNYPDIFIRVSHYVDWIKKNMN